MHYRIELKTMNKKSRKKNEKKNVWDNGDRQVIQSMKRDWGRDKEIGLEQKMTSLKENEKKKMWSWWRRYEEREIIKIQKWKIEGCDEEIKYEKLSGRRNQVRKERTNEKKSQVELSARKMAVGCSQRKKQTTSLKFGMLLTQLAKLIFFGVLRQEFWFLFLN